MAKKENQEILQNDVDNVDTVLKTKAVNLVKMADGSEKNFGKSMKLLSSEEVTPTGFTVQFHLVTGEQVVYTSEDATASEFTRQQAAFGVASKVKGSCAGVAATDLFKTITDKVADITAGNFVSRVTGELKEVLSYIQIAWAFANDIDHTTTEGLVAINAAFATMTSDEKSALYKNTKIGVKLAQLRLDAAILAAEKAEKESIAKELAV